MKRVASISRSSLAIVALAGALPGSPAAAQSPSWDRRISVEVHAPDHKPDGTTWDPVVPNVGFELINGGDPSPDMMLCVVDESGVEACIHDSTKNRFGVPHSICPKAYVCVFANAKSPSTGYFGFLIIDLDVLPQKQDYMLGAVLRYGPRNSARASAIEGKLRALAMKWHAVGVPDAFPEAEVADCGLSNPCFGDMRGGIPSVSISDAVDAELDECLVPILGELTVDPRTQLGSVDFQFRMTQNKCPGTAELVWRYGDGKSEITVRPQSNHRFDRPGDFTVSVAARCVRKSGTCQTAPQSTRVAVER